MLYYGLRRRLRMTLRIPKRKRPPPVLRQPVEEVVERHSWIVRSALQHGPPDLDLTNQAVCEVGAGDCLASSAAFLARGASHVDIIEVEPPFIIPKQIEVLRTLKAQGLPIDESIIRTGSELQLDSSRVSYHRCYMENFQSSERHEFIYSFSVVEHVEDLDDFYNACWKTLKPGGWMLHLVDLGGHEAFEDPLPPLDFQTYPDWFYAIMCPRYTRATRRFLEEHKKAVTKAGFSIKQVTPTRRADEQYLTEVWPKLRCAARSRSREEVGVIEFALLARKEAGVTA